MEKSTRYLAVVSLFSILVLTLYACGGGGGGGEGSTPAPTPDPVEPLSVSGSVTDSDRDPVNGASVTAYNGAGSAVATAATNASGNYELRGLTAGSYDLVAAGPAGTFPTELKELGLSNDNPPTVDLYLPSTAVALIASDDGNTRVYENDDQGNSSMHTELSIDLTTATLSSPQVFLKGINIHEFGTGQAADYPILPLTVANDADRITQWYASAAVEMEGVTLDPTSPAILNLPVPGPLQGFVADPSAPLFKLNAATLVWEQVDADLSTVTPADDPAILDTASGEFYTADVMENGLYRVGEIRDDTVEVTGRTTDALGTALAGATVYLNGTDYGYQQVLTTAADGSFTGFVLGNSSLPKYDLVACKKQAGIQVCATSNLDQNDSPVAVPLGDFSIPLVAGLSTITLNITDLGTYGIVAASGRVYTDILEIDLFSDITLAIQTFGTRQLTVGSASGLVNGGTDVVPITAPQTVTVQTAYGHTATVNISDVVDNGNNMDVTFSAAFVP